MRVSSSLLRRTLAKALKAIYRAADAKAAEEALVAFEASEWGQSYGAIAQSCRRAWAEVVPFFAFPTEVRRIIYMTDVIDKTSGFKIYFNKFSTSQPAH